jgi:two-component system, OmpR family, phosphate regulon sensor histidine kinase PhoR
MKKFRWPAILMVIAILAITGFQLYWLKNNYDREKQSLDIRTSAAFRQTILKLQASKLKLDRFSIKLDSVTVTGAGGRPAVAARSRMQKKPKGKDEPVITMINLLQERMKDSMGKMDPSKRRIITTTDKSFTGTIEFDSAGAFPAEQFAMRMRNAQAGMLDSLKLNPDMIQRVDVKRDSNTHNSIVVINYGGKPPHIKKDTAGKAIEDLVISQTLPKLPKGQVMLQKDTGSWQHNNNAVFRFLYDIDSLAVKDSVTIKEVTTAYANRLKEENLNLKFKVSRLSGADTASQNAVTIGFANPTTFGLTLQSSLGYMLDKLKLPILFSLLLITITIASFFLLYRNMIKQKRLAELKNEFISNITHELKTPIATVGVAIEALKNFNALDDPARTKEYLDISQNELQRLNLLVDKVLKLAVFEKKQLELKKEGFDLRHLIDEVMGTMKLQFEKYGAQASLVTSGDHFLVDADKLHITSVIYNLLDNALKYSSENPVIAISLKSQAQYIEMSVSDNGIGIAPEYRNKIFDKFFRVPTGNRHNIKGYGLGLSYVSEVVKRHHGSITVDSELGKGSTFTVHLPYKESPVVQFDADKRKNKQIG